MKRRSFQRIPILLLCFTLLICTLLSSVSCGHIKDLTPYREEFAALIENSFEINEILFGDGLPVYSRDESLGELYHSTEKDAEFVAYFKETTGKEFDEQLYIDKESKFRLYHWLYRDPVLTKTLGENIYICKYSMTYYLPEGVDESGKPDYDMVTEIRYALQRESAEVALPSGLSVGDLIYTTAKGISYYDLPEYEEPKFEYEYGTNDNKNYDVVRLDAKYLSIDAIKEAAEKVYSADYLSAIYASTFDGIRNDFEDESSTVLLARYIEESSGEGEPVYLRKSNVTKSLFSEQRAYDYTTMQIRSPYSRSRVNVTIQANGTYFDTSEKVMKDGWHTVNLSFVLQDGVWRLDSPTY